MRVRVTGKDGNGQFEPFTVAFTIETEEEAEMFHDHVAITGPWPRCDFIGHVYERCDGLTRGGS